ncbi:helix-turn-helix domain-containing protein [Bacillus timonensis]|uniref:helix-turn-helix domain-containing protein n=1 Tax=Bacillus timonensis TaxID=1033734 RepID=UPI0002882B92|nr:helix-turn-helix domain-containing protein [Bacillus timonensis]
MKSIIEYPETLQVKDIKEILRIGQRQAYELVKSKSFENIRINQSRYYSKKRFIHWLEGKELA